MTDNVSHALCYLRIRMVNSPRTQHKKALGEFLYDIWLKGDMRKALGRKALSTLQEGECVLHVKLMSSRYFSSFLQPCWLATSFLQQATFP